MQQFRDILCMVEPQATSQPALERAIELATNSQASVTVAMVVGRSPMALGLPLSGFEPEDLQAKLEEAEAQWLETLIEPQRAQHRIEARVLVGSSPLEIVREVLRNDHDLVIKSPESNGWLGRLFASEDMQLLRKCPVPVWLENAGTQKPYKRILAAVDVADDHPPAELEVRRALNERVIELASSLAVSELAELHVVHAWDALGESTLRHRNFMGRPQAEVDAYVEQIHSRHARHLDELVQASSAKPGGRDVLDYLEPRLHLLKGSARKVIPELARELEIDCIVMGTVARTGIPGFIMGNTAETILQQIECSVLAIKPDGFETPVTLER